MGAEHEFEVRFCIRPNRGAPRGWSTMGLAPLGPDPVCRKKLFCSKASETLCIGQIIGAEHEFEVRFYIRRPNRGALLGRSTMGLSVFGGRPSVCRQKKPFLFETF
jgi:hypothetical protein